jgi:hypothetical protein
MIVIGADTHKRTHMLVGVDAGTGQLLGDRQIAASDDGHRDAVRWARGFTQNACGRSRTADTSRDTSRRR